MMYDKQGKRLEETHVRIQAIEGPIEVDICEPNTADSVVRSPVSHHAVPEGGALNAMIGRGYSILITPKEKP